MVLIQYYNIAYRTTHCAHSTISWECKEALMMFMRCPRDFKMKFCRWVKGSNPCVIPNVIFPLDFPYIFHN